MKTIGYAAQNAQSPLKPFEFERREPKETDVSIEILFCGICHSDIHTARGEWEGVQFPVVPGHEIIGRVTAIGSEVKKFKQGDIVGVGCLVDSCQTCSACQSGLEQLCENGMTGTYNSVDKIAGTPHKMTFGGYSRHIIVQESFVLSIPENLDLAASAPLLCAGITTYSPLKYWNVGPGQKVGVIGLGGLGHMGIKFAHALGAHVTMITTSPEKAKTAKELGADDVLISTDEQAMKKAKNSFDFLLNTIPVPHDITPYLELLCHQKTMVIVGVLDLFKQVDGRALIRRNRNLAGSLIGGLSQTQEMLDFCGKHNITCDIEKINISEVNQAYDRTVKGDVKYRFVIDMASLTETPSV